MSLKGLLVTAEKWITVKIPAELTEDGIAIERVFKKGESILAAEIGKWFGEVKAQIESDETVKTHGVITQPIHAVEVTVADPPVQGEAAPTPTPAPAPEPAPTADAPEASPPSGD